MLGALFLKTGEAFISEINPMLDAQYRKFNRKFLSVVWKKYERGEVGLSAGRSTMDHVLASVY